MGIIILIGVIVIVIVVVVALVGAARHSAKKQRLMSKYGDAEVVGGIMQRRIWQGQTVEQLIDSIGKPLDVDQKVLKTKSKDILKYNRVGKNRYALRVTVENGVVVGWDKK